MLLPFATWIPILDGEETAAALYERHYSAAKRLNRRRERGTLLFLGPGEKLILATPCRRALFGWRLAKHRKDKQKGIECAIFRNEGAGLSSELITAADAIADAYWPGLRHFTYVDPEKTGSRRARSAKPGACFIHAGWNATDIVSQRGLVLLERPAA